MIPLWAVFGFSAAFLYAVMMLLQERLKLDGVVVSIWCKVAALAMALPFVILHGIPSDPLFYIFLTLHVAIVAAKDVVFFRKIHEVGAGVVSRLMPLTVFSGFLLWFAVDPALAARYAEKPLMSLLILLVLGLAAWFAMSLKKCAVSMRAVRGLWFVLLADTLGPVMAKIVTRHAGMEQGVWGFIFFEGLIMVVLLQGYLLGQRPIPPAALYERRNMGGGLLIGAVVAAMAALSVAGVYSVDNPGYISALVLVNSVIILAAHRLMGQEDGSDARPGLGIVACAMALIVLKAKI